MARVITALVPLLVAAYADANCLEYPDSINSIRTDSLSTILDEVVVTAPESVKLRRIRSSQNIIGIDRKSIMGNIDGSLMQSLDIIPGLQSMKVGAAQSKPAIRGFGFNRMVVSENGIKHEGQQWGEEHGLEIDQFAVDNVEVVKGPAALLYGSDAIGGVINVNSRTVPHRCIGGSVDMYFRSVNDAAGLAAQIYGRPNTHLWYRAGVTMMNYADTKVPADSIQYYSYWVKLRNRRLRNTAGREYDGNILVGYQDTHFKTDISISDVYNKSGFFADLHGLEVRLSDIDYDRSVRDIDLPFHLVNHLKIINNTQWRTGNVKWTSAIGWQNNFREEHSESVSHGFMPKPNSTLERRFVKNTLSANVSSEWTHRNFRLNSGIGYEHQHNKRGGWGFIIPDFNVSNFGIYLTGLYSVSQRLDINAGIRVDRNMTRIKTYSDWYKTPVENGDSIYKERSPNLSRHFGSLTWSAGISWHIPYINIKLNIGKSFRVPTPQELGADGVNYHIFRYEKGNPNLDPEQSYQLDLGFLYDNGVLSLRLDPYLNYFPNYIYLNPTSGYTEGLQTYVYTQSRVLRCGFEFELTYRFLKNWEAWGNCEYLYSRQLSGTKKGYSLPFTPPPTAIAGIKYLFNSHELLDGARIEIYTRMSAAQRRIVPPELPTDAYCTLNIGAGKDFSISGQAMSINLRVTNLLNRRYYNHTSYYRLADIPEPGRNISLTANWNF